MNIHNNRGFAQFLGEALVLAAELLYFLLLRIPFGLGAALVRGQALEHAGLPLATPSDQVRGVKTFAALQGSDGAGLCGGGIRLGQDTQFVLGGEGPTLGLDDNLRVGSRRSRRLGREEIPLFFTLIPILALLSNYDQEDYLINVGTEGDGTPKFIWLLRMLERL